LWTTNLHGIYIKYEQATRLIWKNCFNAHTVTSEFRHMGHETIQVISQPDRIKQIYLSLVRSAKNEVLVIFPTANAVRREDAIGVIDELKKAKDRGAVVRILTPEDDFIRDKLDTIKSTGIKVREIETPTDAKFKLLIADRKISLVVETADDSKSDFYEAIGLATLSSSKPTVLPYVTIFESFWREADLYEQAAESDRIKDDFINVAAHELRNPITPIISAVEFVNRDFTNIARALEKTADTETKRKFDNIRTNLAVIMRNTKRLMQLAEDILQVSRIQSGTFALNLQHTNIGSIIDTTIADIQKKYQKAKPDVTVRFVPSPNVDANNLQFYCDGPKIAQALFNLLDNAVKFTKAGLVEISLSQEAKELIFAIKDSGMGIDLFLKDKLFEKFAVARSSGGTGLGLYLCRKIIEAHGGRIWGQNNMPGPGATFAFALPIDLMPLDATTNAEPETTNSATT
jgi:K+-sensing histidine kinase KdpD